MTLTIKLKPNLESLLRQRAAKRGIKPDALVVQALKQQLHHDPAGQPRLSKSESNLLLKINSGPRGLSWDRYHELLARNRDETITPIEHRELLEMIHAIEKANAQRISNLIKLARLRGVSLDSLMESLGIQPPPIE